VELIRFAFFDDRTIGRLEHDGQFFWTVEKPWKNNEPFVSCIPAGTYSMGLRDSPKFGPNTWEVLDVPNRSHILFHVGNHSSDVVGCIALGDSLFSNLEGVGNSRKAVDRFKELLAGQESQQLIIEEHCIRE